MQVSFKITKRRAIIAGIVIALAAASVAAAAWMLNANGPATAKIGSLTGGVTIGNQLAYPTGDLLPGGSAGSVFIKVSNTSGMPLKITNVSSSGSVSVQTPATCPSSNVTFTGAGALTTPVTVPAGTSDVLIPGSAFATGEGLRLSAAAPSACQGQTIDLGTITVTFSS
jgi:hypothetical protein